MLEQYKPESFQNNTSVETALEEYQKYLHGNKVVSLVRDFVETKKDELNLIAGREMFDVAETNIPNDIRTFYKVVVKKGVFEDIKKVA